MVDVQQNNLIRSNVYNYWKNREEEKRKRFNNRNRFLNRKQGDDEENKKNVGKMH